MSQCPAVDEEGCVEVVLTPSSLAILSIAALLLVITWAPGAFYELLVSLSHPLQPVELSIASEQLPPYDIISIRVCVADWLRAEELQLVVLSPGGRIVYQSGVVVGSDGCMTVAVRLREAEEGVYTVAVVRRGTTLTREQLQVLGRPHHP